MASPVKWVLCQKDDHMKLHDDGQRVTVAPKSGTRLAYALGLPLGAIDGWKFRLQWKSPVGVFSGNGIMQYHLCTRIICTLPLFYTLTAVLFHLARFPTPTLSSLLTACYLR